MKYYNLLLTEGLFKPNVIVCAIPCQVNSNMFQEDVMVCRKRVFKKNIRH